jgi:hypothetical protein
VRRGGGGAGAVWGGEVTEHATTLRAAILAAFEARGQVVQRGDWLAQYDVRSALVNIGLVVGGLPGAVTKLSTVGPMGHPSTWPDAAWERNADAFLRWVLGPRGEA